MSIDGVRWFRGSIAYSRSAALPRGLLWVSVRESQRRWRLTDAKVVFGGVATGWRLLLTPSPSSLVRRSRPHVLHLPNRTRLGEQARRTTRNIHSRNIAGELVRGLMRAYGRKKPGCVWAKPGPGCVVYRDFGCSVVSRVQLVFFGCSVVYRVQRGLMRMGESCCVLQLYERKYIPVPTRIL